MLRKLSLAKAFETSFRDNEVNGAMLMAMQEDWLDWSDHPNAKKMHFKLLFSKLNEYRRKAGDAGKLKVDVMVPKLQLDPHASLVHVRQIDSPTGTRFLPDSDSDDGTPDPSIDKPSTTDLGSIGSPLSETPTSEHTRGPSQQRTRRRKNSGAKNGPPPPPAGHSKSTSQTPEVDSAVKKMQEPSIKRKHSGAKSRPPRPPPSPP